MAVSRRNFLQGVAATTLAGTGESMAHAAEKESPPHVALVNRGELSVLFGDSAAHGMGRTGYCGIWSLTSAQQPFNAFVSSYAGFIFNSQRGRPVELRRLAEDRVEFVLNDPGFQTRAHFTVREPYYVDCEATVTLQNKISGPYLLQSWASYVNSPEDNDIYFRHAGNWIRAHSPQHGVEATYAPASLKDIEDDLRHVTPEERKNNFVYGYSQQRFTEPFYYGRLRNMALAYFFDDADAVRFTLSPSGGGTSILPGKSCPAWDWLWLIRDAQPGKPSTLRMRMVYKAFVSPEDILDEFTRWRK